MTLAIIFDLDNTLIAGDSDHRWGEFLCEQGYVDRCTFAEKNDQFYTDYQSGHLDIAAYLHFVLEPLKGMTVAQVKHLQDKFLEECIAPMCLHKANALLDAHRQRGDRLLIITATNTVITRPIATHLGVVDLIGCEAKTINGVWASQSAASFQAGKVQRLKQWLIDEDETLQDACFWRLTQ